MMLISFFATFSQLPCLGRAVRETPSSGIGVDPQFRGTDDRDRPL
jgi:hypothetical protein